MNIKLYFAGFILCFSSFGMTDANKQKEHEPIVSIVSQPELSGGLLCNEGNELKKDFYILETGPRIIGETLEDKERNDKAILRIANLINGQDIEEALNLLKRHSLDKTFNVNTVFTNGKENYTLLSYYFLYFLKYHIQCVVANNTTYFIHLGRALLVESKDQFIVEEQDKKDYYIRRNDPRMRDIIISLITNLQFFTATHFLMQLESDLHRTFFDYGEPFMYNLGDGQKEYTLCSLYISVLKDTILKYSGMGSPGYESRLVVSRILENVMRPLEKKTCYIIKNDERIIDIGLCAIDRKFFELEDEFYNRCYNRYLDVDSIMGFEDISHVVFSFYYMCIAEVPYKLYSIRNEILWALNYARDTLKRDKTYDLTKKYKENMLKMISYLEEKKYHRLARLFLKEYFSNEKLQTPGIEYNILSCYQYVLNQMEFRENVHAGAHSIAKPQVTPTELRDIMIFLEEKKCHIITNALFSEYGPNKILDANTVFKYDVGGCEKACTPVALSVLYTLTELADRNKAYEFGKECKDLKKYLLDNVLISKSVPILNKCIANTQGSRQQSLISLKENIKLSDLAYRYFLHLHNEMLQLRKKIKQQIINEYKTCVEIMKWMLYYQAQ